ncbi:MAG: acyltransferase family protein [Acidimicrobiales bacterium]|nr:acyltransferase family protein [Acidimicrobiales bacterium]
MDEATNVIVRPPVTDDAAGGRRVAEDVAERRPTTLDYNPALDGIRGLAVAAVLLFHAGFPWARGGYLGVSTFFTLSGFLITSLLLVERSATGRISLGRFWARRLRRLLPASALTLAAVAVGSHLFDELWTEGLDGDLLASLFQVANWRFIFDDQSYADLFATPSPVLHFWSLAIEEQFYWVFPLLTAGVFAVAKGSVKVYAVVLTGLFALSAAATVALGVDESATVYYATYTRMGEILVGSLLAVAVAAGLARHRAVARYGGVAGAVALVLTLWAWWNVEQQTPAVSRGGLLAYALVSGLLVLAASVPGPVRRLLAVAPLRLLGVVSYGVYLVHWPIFLVVDAERTGLGRAPLFALRLTITLAVAVVSYHLVERPIRRGWSMPRVPMPALAAASVAVVALTASVVPAPAGPTDEQLAAYVEGLKFQDPNNIPPDARIGVAFGDSTMFETGMGLASWGRETEDLVIPDGIGALLGCGITRGGERRSRGEATVAPAGCDDWPDEIPRSVRSVRETFGRVEFALIQTGPWDVADRRLEGDDRWRAPGDPVYDDYLYSELSLATDLFVEEGLVVVWLLAPHIDVGRNEEPPPDPPYSESEPERMDRLNEIIQRVADERDSVVAVDLAGYMQRLPGGEMDRELRPDGVHFTVESATEVADWLGPAVLEAVASEPNPLAPPPMPPGTTTTTAAE